MEGRYSSLLAASKPSSVFGFEPSLLLVFERRFLGDQVLHALETAGVEISRLHRLSHGTTRLLLVLAVTEPAVIHEFEDVGESPLDAMTARPQADGSHTRCVDKPSSRTDRIGRQSDQIRSRGGVSTALITFSYFGRSLNYVTYQGVDNGALADTARTEQSNRSIATCSLA
jgi:hypothetical protein